MKNWVSLEIDTKDALALGFTVWKNRIHRDIQGYMGMYGDIGIYPVVLIYPHISQNIPLYIPTYPKIVMKTLATSAARSCATPHVVCSG